MLIETELMKCYCCTTWNVVTIIIERIGWVRLAQFFMKLTVLAKYPWKKYSSQSPHSVKCSRHLCTNF